MTYRDQTQQRKQQCSSSKDECHQLDKEFDIVHEPFLDSKSSQGIKRNKKLTRMERVHQRDIKHSASSLEDHRHDLLSAPIPKVDSPNRFMTLNCLPVSSTEHSLTKRQISRTVEECSPDRIEFCKTFSLLIKMGSVKSEEHFVHVSTNQQISEHHMWQTRWIEVLWLALQAWQADRTMQEQDKYLYSKRQEVSNILDEVMNFRVPSIATTLATDTIVKFTISTSSVVPMSSLAYSAKCSSICASEINVSTAMVFCNKRETSDEETYPSVPFTPFNLISTNDILKQREALLHVTVLMNKLEDVERLYPNLKALMRDSTLYGSEEFTKRIETICVWLNITKGMNQKLKLMAKVLGVDNIDDLVWPGLECEISNPLLKTGNTDDLCIFDMDGVTQGTDKFDVTPSSTSTPLKESRTRYDGRSNIGRYIFGTRIYRPFVDKSLKQMGVHKMFEMLLNLLDGTLQRATQALRCPDRFSEETTTSGCKSPDNDNKYTHTILDMLEERMSSMERRHSLLTHGSSSLEFIQMGLPSFRPTYLFLIRIPLHVMHECLKLRLEQKPAAEPSRLSITQLIRECKEVITGSIVMKQYYQRMVTCVLWDNKDLKEKLDNDMDEYEKDLKEMLQVYFEYLHSWIQMLQRMPQASLSLKDVIQEEWNFAKEVCQHITGGEAQAGQRFCVMASGLLTSTSEFLSNKMDDLCSYLQDSTSFSETIRRTILESCRGFKQLFHESRERASKALGFAKMLRKVVTSRTSDYQLFIPQNLKNERSQILQLLNVTFGKDDLHDPGLDDQKNNKYLLILKPDSNIQRMCPLWDGDTVEVNPSVETTIALAAVESEALTLSEMITTAVHQVDENLDLDLLADIEEMERINMRYYYKETMHSCFNLGFEIDLSANHRNVKRPMFVSPLSKTSAFGALSISGSPMDTYAFPPLPSDTVAPNLLVESPGELPDLPDLSQPDGTLPTSPALFHLHIWRLSQGFLAELSKFLASAQSEYESRWRLYIVWCNGMLIDHLRPSISEYHKEVSHLVTGDNKQKLGHGLLKFAMKWMQFVLNKCEQGRGTRP
uniref:Mitogen-activated protein kinase kinase kinase 4-like n=1 Tax=Saccoglossus kowalevskii TaxID=10224 RepID=A0ABM0MLC7_SACKO